MIYANDFSPRDGMLRLHLLTHDQHVKKADAFFVSLDGECYLIDGGMTDDTTAYAYLLRFRAALLERVPADAAHAPLRINWVVSHFHQDHMGATIQYILHDRRIALDRVYLPPRTEIDPKYPENGDTKYRALCLSLIECHHPQAEVITLSFGGDKRIVPFGEGEITFYPPEADWGVGDKLAYIVDNYYKGNYDEPHIAVAAVNACCLWMRIRYGGRSCLFTGDTMKRKASLDAEAFDTMLARWGEDIGEVDIVKWLHHGIIRDAAAEGMLSMKPKRIIVSHPNATASDALRAYIAEHGGEMPEFITTAKHNVLVEISADGGIKCEKQ